jgi:hypothetical protein
VAGWTSLMLGAAKNACGISSNAAGVSGFANAKITLPGLMSD